MCKYGRKTRTWTAACGAVVVLATLWACGKAPEKPEAKPPARTPAAAPAKTPVVTLAKTPVKTPPPTAQRTPSVPVAVFQKNLQEAQTRGMVSRARTDMRSLATAIEAYYIDWNWYPPYGVGAVSVNSALAPDSPASALPSFRLEMQEGKLRFGGLSTPVAYVTRYPPDPFAPAEGATFVYWSIAPGQADPSGTIAGEKTPQGWILASAGPDGDYDLADEYDVYDSSALPPALTQLIGGTSKKGSAFTYDPTNGTVSDGDIWRVKQ